MVYKPTSISGGPHLAACIKSEACNMGLKYLSETNGTDVFDGFWESFGHHPATRFPGSMRSHGGTTQCCTPFVMFLGL